MAETEFLAIGDLHLGKLASVFPGDKGLTYQFHALKDGFDYAVTHGIRNVVILGDIYQTPYPSQAVMSRFADFLGRYSHLKVCMIRGNHDLDDMDNNSLQVFQTYSTLGALSNAKLYLSPTLDDMDGVPMYYLSFPYHKIPKNIPPAVVFAHLDFNGAKRDNGETIRGALDVPQGPDHHWIVGHIHTYQRINDHLLYPGTMLQTNFGESLPKGMVHVRCESRKGQIKIKCQFIPYDPPYTLHNVYVETAEDLKEVTNEKGKYYKLFRIGNVEIPPTWNQDHPNVIKWGGKTEGFASVATSKVVENKGRLDHRKRLIKFLREQGLRDKQIEVALKVVKRIAHKVGVESWK